MGSRTFISARSARNSRKTLIRLMGGRCAKCGSAKRLEFHHLSPRTWIANKCNRWVRIARYRRDWLAGSLELLCRKCNACAGSPRGTASAYASVVIPP